MLEHGEPEVALGPDRDAQLLFQQLGAIQLLVRLCDPGQLRLLAGGQVLGVAPQREAAAFQGLRVRPHAGSPGLFQTSRRTSSRVLL